MFARPCRLPAIHRLNLQQVWAFGLPVKHSLCIDESQLWVNTKILVVPTAILQQGVGDLRGGWLDQMQLYRGSDSKIHLITANSLSKTHFNTIMMYSTWIKILNSLSLTFTTVCVCMCASLFLPCHWDPSLGHWLKPGKPKLLILPPQWPRPHRWRKWKMGRCHLHLEKTKDRKTECLKIHQKYIFALYV